MKVEIFIETTYLNLNFKTVMRFFQSTYLCILKQLNLLFPYLGQVLLLRLYKHFS